MWCAAARSHAAANSGSGRAAARQKASSGPRCASPSTSHSASPSAATGAPSWIARSPAVEFTVTTPAARDSMASSGPPSTRWTRPAAPAARAILATRLPHRFSPGSNGWTLQTRCASPGAPRAKEAIASSSASSIPS